MDFTENGQNEEGPNNHMFEEKRNKSRNIELNDN